MLRSLVFLSVPGLSAQLLSACANEIASFRGLAARERWLVPSLGPSSAQAATLIFGALPQDHGIVANEDDPQVPSPMPKTNRVSALWPFKSFNTREWGLGSGERNGRNLMQLSEAFVQGSLVVRMLGVAEVLEREGVSAERAIRQRLSRMNIVFQALVDAAHRAQALLVVCGEHTFREPVGIVDVPKERVRALGAAAALTEDLPSLDCAHGVTRVYRGIEREELGLNLSSLPEALALTRSGWAWPCQRNAAVQASDDKALLPALIVWDAASGGDGVLTGLKPVVSASALSWFVAAALRGETIGHD